MLPVWRKQKPSVAPLKPNRCCENNKGDLLLQIIKAKALANEKDLPCKEAK
jgi:hypothetical protein